MNYKHLHYFWATAHAGGIVAASERLHMSPQTLSGQIKLLEDRLGRKLFRKAGRRLELTDDGRLALRYADEIFHLGAELQGALSRRQAHERVLEFRVAVADSVDKTAAYRLLEPAMAIEQSVHLICSEGTLAELLGQLALHQVDLVIADEPLTRKVSVKAFNHVLGRSAVCFHAAPALHARLAPGFPRCLDGAPMLLPGATTSMRRQLDGWLVRHGVRPRVVAEFDDSALAAAFGREGSGVFVAPAVLQREIESQYGVHTIGRSDELVEEFHAISVERRLTHPCVLAITSAARQTLAVP